MTVATNTNKLVEFKNKEVVSNPYKPYRKNLLTNERVKELSQLRPWIVVRDTLWCWAWIILMWVIVATRPELWVVALAIPVIGSRYYALFIIGHDGLHRRLFNNIKYNDLFNDLFIVGPIGAITRFNNSNHILHHIYLSTSKDPDRHKHCCVNKTEVSELFFYISGVGSVFKTILDVYLRPFITRQPKPKVESATKQRKSKGYTIWDLSIILGWQVGLLIILTIAIGWWAYPVLWLVPVYLFTYLADNLRSFIEHSHPESDELADRHRLITHVSNPIERLFIAPMNMNYHTTHHLWPSIPYYNLPIANTEIRKNLDTEGLIWRKTYLGYLFRYMMALPLDECKVQAANIKQSGVLN